MAFSGGVKDLDAVGDDGVDRREVGPRAVGPAVAAEVEGDRHESLFRDGDGGQLEEPAALGGVAVDHGDEAARGVDSRRRRAPRLSEDVHVLVVEDEALLVDDAMFLVELLAC